MTESHLLTDLGIVAASATGAAIICDRLKIPAILGYVGVGLALGAQVIDFHILQDTHSLFQLSELGVLFLLFTLGMEFDLQKLKNLVGSSLIALILQTILMLSIGTLTAPLLGFDKATGIFLGSLLAISSSMVTIRVLKDQKQMQHAHAQLAIGILILEDILAILLLVVLSGIDVTGSLPWSSAIWTIFIISVFVVVIFYFGRILMPGIVNTINRIGSLELVTLFAVGSVLGIGVIAEQIHLSLALGAFLAGSLFSNSALVERIEDSINPLKELFSAVFFVTIGMRINPEVVLAQAPIIILLSLLVVVGKTASCWVGLFLSGQRSKTAFQAAVAKSQIGEFSFVIASLALATGVADEGLMSIAVGVAIFTIITTPLISSRSSWIYDNTLDRSPSWMRSIGRIYHDLLNGYRTLISKSIVIRLMRRPFWQIIAAFLIICGLIFAAFVGANLARNGAVPDALQIYLLVGVWVVCAILVTPFVLSITRNLSAISLIIVDALSQIYKNNKLLKSGHLRNLLSYVFSVVLIFIVGNIFLGATSDFLPTGIPLLLFGVLIAALAFIFSRQMIKINSVLENRFVESLKEETRDLEAQRREEILSDFQKEHLWHALTGEELIEPNSYPVGKQIVDLKLREQANVTIIAIKRGDQYVYDPNPRSHIFAGDTLILLGKEAALANARKILKSQSLDTETLAEQAFCVEAIYIPTGSMLEGNTLAGAELRRKHRITVVAIKRETEEVEDPSPSQVIQCGDILLIAGKRGNVEKFQKVMEAA